MASNLPSYVGLKAKEAVNLGHHDQRKLPVDGNAF